MKSTTPAFYKRDAFPIQLHLKLSTRAIAGGTILPFSEARTWLEGLWLNRSLWEVRSELTSTWFQPPSLTGSLFRSIAPLALQKVHVVKYDQSCRWVRRTRLRFESKFELRGKKGRESARRWLLPFLWRLVPGSPSHRPRREFQSIREDKTGFELG